MKAAPEIETMPRRRMTAAARREVILGAALDVFADSGYHETSLATVAGRAGVSKALIYEHFGSKRELYEALLETYVHEMLDRVRASATAAEPGEARLMAGLNGFFDFVEERRDAWRLLIRHRASDDVADSFERLFDEVAEMIVSLMEGEMPVSVLPEGTEFEAMVDATARQLLGAITAMANWWDEHREIPREQVMAMVMEFAWVGLERCSAGERWKPGPV